ncbi:MAG TPA: UDP-N-acetylglucosamine 2-epimerase (non-hydrolyzing) [Calditrichia bacterium]|nr:UDP-N-acetylglucosamine 2-epimerase (non-hydrolyzing) [Calditrichota bacterium]HQU71189.1 UDP-N-acetylglucosamine 2-epimerase (non-hydrolyzing) [Calditrichia bacterium]HQV30347.1 UDP-N-acetylglucosamine 2-epimerase (non-hydrolyzing) [Calditrichia bacterium]
MKIISVVGARPQFVKLAPLSRRLRKVADEVIVHTGQHYDANMSDSFFEDMNIARPDYSLNVGSGRHGEQTGRMLIELEKVMMAEKPDAVVVFGDTNSTLAAALAAVKLHIKTVHVEAGLRSFNREMPEEINRIMTDHCSDYLFAPTPIAMDNLRKENLGPKSYLFGDIMVDALLDNLDRAESQSKIVERLELAKRDYVLVTLHRPYNVDDPARLTQIFKNLADLPHTVVFPIHPRTRAIVAKYDIPIPEQFVLIDPVGYLDFLKLQKHCERILTDSGGIQKEAYIQEKPCITLRSETEWLETLEVGWNILMDPANPNLAAEVAGFSPPAAHPAVFGEQVAQKMVDFLVDLDGCD